MSKNYQTVQGFKGIEFGKGVFDLKASSPLPPKDKFKRVNTEDYRQAFLMNPIIFWGKDNCFPQQLDEVARQCSVLESGLKILSDHLAGQGLYLGIEHFENGKRIVEEVENEPLLEMMYNGNFYEYWDAACGELPRWGNVFPVHKLTDKRKYSQIRIYDSPWCRLERHDPEDAEIKHIYVSSQWWRGMETLLSDGIVPEDLKKWIFKIPLLNDFDPAVQMNADKENFSFAQHIKYRTSGHDYGRAPWHACYEAGWLGISKGVPKMIQKIFESTMTLNFNIGIDSDYWKSRFENWDDDTKWTPRKRSEAILEFQKSIEKNLIGADNSYKSIFYTLFRVNGNEQLPALKIDPVQNKIKEGDNYIPNSQQADGQILNSIGLDPSMLGVTTPGGKQSAGSGSNVRESSLALTARLRPDRERLLEPWNTMRDFMLLENKSLEKDKDIRKIKVYVRDYIINTLDGRAPAAGKEVTSS